MSNKLYETAYMTDTETGFTYTCLKGEVATKKSLYPTQKEITEKEYNELRGVDSNKANEPTKAQLLAELVELDRETELTERSKKDDIVAALELIKESNNA